VNADRLQDPATARKARGAFFTPPELCAFVARWAIRNAADRVLEPSCGEAAFLLACGECLRAFGSGAPDERQLTGIELHPESAVRARARLAENLLPATVTVANFFDCEAPGKPYDIVTGNPPYVRYQGFTGEERRKAREAALAQGVRISGLASSWAAFVVQATSFLAPEGRMGLVLPAELLTVNYAAPIREFLLRRFSQVRLILFEKLIFPDVLEEVVLLLAEGQGPTPHFELCQVQGLDDLLQMRVAPSRWAPETPAEKWTGALISKEAADRYRSALDQGIFQPLLDWGETYLGMVTGNNRYFTLSAAEANSLKLPRKDLIPISPPGSRHLRDLSFSRVAWEEMVESDFRAFLFRPESGKPKGATAAYIRKGEKEKVHTAYKCRVRSPWWRVPVVPTPHLFLTYMNHDTPRLVANPDGFGFLNSIHGVGLHPDRVEIGSEVLPVAALNSLTLLAAELVGRSYGGGMLKIEPKEADQLAVPSAPLLQASREDLLDLRPQLSEALRGGDLPGAVQLVDRVLLLQHAGFQERDLTTLQKAREHLFSRRAARGDG
jgi:adenine-specific DNA-methyltransferase